MLGGKIYGLLLLTAVSFLTPIFSVFRLHQISLMGELNIIIIHLISFVTILFLLVCLKFRIRADNLDYFLLLVCITPVIRGLFVGNLNTSFFNDIASYFFFCVKLVLLKQVCKYHIDHTTFFPLFKRFLMYTVIISIPVYLACYLFFDVLESGGPSYYQIIVDLTLPFAYALTFGSVGLVLFFGFLAVMSSKKMIVVGLIIMLTSYSRRHILSVRRLIIVSVLSLCLGTIIGFYFWHSVHNFKLVEGLFEFALKTDAPRVIEIASLYSALSFQDVVFGTGYGFNYQLDENFIASLGLNIANRDVTNCHFSPLGILSKFGIVGFVLFSYIFISPFFKKNLAISSQISKLILLSYLIQSFFAYSLFLNPFIPFLLSFNYLKEDR